MHKLFNITTLTELESAFEHYKNHMLEAHNLPLKKTTKAQEKFAQFLGYPNYATVVSEFKKKEEAESEMLDAALMMSGLPCTSFYTKNKRYSIATKMNTDDYTHVVDFDSSLVFEDALKKGRLIPLLRSLVEDAFSGGYGTDELALFFQSVDKPMSKFLTMAHVRVREAFEHNENLPRDVEERGFSVTVDESDIYNWCLANCDKELMKEVDIVFQEC